MFRRTENADPWVYIFASLLADRPKYRQEALNILALPRGLTHKLRYETKWIALEGTLTTDALRSWVGRTVVIVSVVYEDEQARTRPRFYPLRLGRLVDAEVEAGVGFIFFEVTEYFRYDTSSDFDADIKAALKESDRPPLHFVAIGANSGALISAISSDPGTGWASTVSQLATIPEFSKQGFVRVTSCRSLRKGRFKSLSPAPLFDDPRQKGFRLQTREQYALDLMFLSPNYESGSVTLSCDFNDALMEPLDGDTINMDTRYDSRTLRVFVKEASTSRYSAARVHSTQDPLSNPEFVIPFELQPRSVSRYALAAMMLIGLAAGAASQAVGMDTPKVILAIIGAVVPAFVIFMVTGELKK